MKNILLFLIAGICMGRQAAAQRIHFVDTSNRWINFISGGGTEYYEVIDVIRLQGDSTFGGHTYKKMITDTNVIHQNVPWLPAGNYPGGPYFFREDTALRLVYGRMSGDTAETVIYNAGWRLGDTAFHFSTTRYVVRKIDSVGIGNLSYKVFHFRRNADTLSTVDAMTIVEGIGCIFGPWYPVLPINNAFEYNAQLLCFRYSGGKPVLNAALVSENAELRNSFDNTSGCKLSVPDVFPLEGITLRPNPGSIAMTLQCKSALANGRLIIHDLYGQVVVQKMLHNDMTIPIGSMLSAAGSYFYRIDDLQNGGSATGKITFLGN